MSDNIDKKLVNRINQVFENFEDDSAVQGWEKLREKYPPESNRRPVFFWISSVAAVLLLAIGFWLITDTKPETENLTKVKEGNQNNKQKEVIIIPDSSVNINTPEPEKSEVTALKLVKKRPFPAKKKARINSDNLEEKPTLINPYSIFQEESENALTIFALEPKKKIQPDSVKVEPGKSNVSKNTSTYITAAATPTPDDVKDVPLTKNAEASNSVIDLDPVTANKNMDKIEAIKLNPTISAKVNEDLKIAHKIDSAQLKNTEPLISKLIVPPVSIAKLKEKAIKKAEKLNPSKRISLGFFAGSYFNYASGSQNSYNSGAGFSSEFRLTNKIKFSTGVSIAQNSLKYQQVIPESAAEQLDNVGNKNNFLDINSRNNPYAYSSSISAYPVTRAINSYDAKLTGLDIPVNLKYTVIDKTKSLYLVAGFSSNYFFNESYTYGFNYLVTNNNNTGALDSKSTQQEVKSRFQSFDFARMLNLSVGFEYPIDKLSRLSLEPFVKYPLSGLGSHDLKFGAAGINLKLLFNSKNK